VLPPVEGGGGGNGYPSRPAAEIAVSTTLINQGSMDVRLVAFDDETYRLYEALLG
jgi:hypothetical protein